MHEQNMAIVKSLVSVAWADGVFAEAERDMVEALIAAFDANENEAAEIRAYAATERTLDDIPLSELSTDDRRILLQHAVLLSYVDGEQSEVERTYLKALYERLHIPEDEAMSLIRNAEERAKRFLNVR